jgi:hypothetical protein
MPAYDIVRYIVIQKMIGNEKALCVLKNYVNNVSPSIIMEICKATRHEIIGYLQRIRERSGNIYRGFIVAKYTLMHIDTIPTLVSNDGYKDKTAGRCPFCNRYSGNLVFHIEIKHGKEIHKYIDTMIEVLRDKVINGKKVKNT